MTKEEMQNNISKVLCGKDETITCDECYKTKKSYICKNSSQCRIAEKTEKQLEYVLSSINKNIFLEACPGSGKTEVVGMKSAYEINKWDRNSRVGIAILTFTNDATNVIKERVSEFSQKTVLYPHFIGTVSSFIHEYIAQPFGYKLMGYKSKNSDFSFRIIDKDLGVNLNQWLKNYKCEVINTNDNPLFSNQITLDYKKKDCLIPESKYRDIYFREHYESDAFQNEVEAIRVRTKKNWLFNYRYCLKLLIKDKYKFNKDGFANFDDINNIAYKVLQKSVKIASLISSKFPVIMIDECQDLSWIELQIIDILKQNGSSIHFIGDLNQSVYEFKNIDPQDTYNYLKDFRKLELIDNFRSCQPIVDLSNKILNLKNNIRGIELNKLKEKSLLYLEYEDPKDIIEKYMSIMDLLEISHDKSCVIVKQNILKDNLLNTNIKNEKHLMISAIQLWENGNVHQKQNALENAGKQISKWFGGAKNKKNYYCPNDINSAFRWRLFIRDILNDSIKTDLIDFDKKYKDWYKTARLELPQIIKKRYISLLNFDESEREFDQIFHGSNWYRAKEAEYDIDNTIVKEPCVKVRIATVHGSKGCTYDSTLVISSKSTKSHSGHWKEHWLMGSGEDKRVGYVASTRAKYLLVWGIPKLIKEDKELIENIGFIDGSVF